MSYPAHGPHITLTPLGAAACAAVAHNLDATLRAEPPPERGWKMPVERGKLPIGGYLLGYGYLRPQQLVLALKLQRRSGLQGSHLMLGDTLVRQQVISARVLATMLIVQLVDRLLADPPLIPTRLGEGLVLSGRIAPVQLAGAIQLQTWLRSAGMECSLSDILIQQNLVTPEDVAAALRPAQGARDERA